MNLKKKAAHMRTMPIFARSLSQNLFLKNKISTLTITAIKISTQIVRSIGRDIAAYTMPLY